MAWHARREKGEGRNSYDRTTSSLMQHMIFRAASSYTIFINTLTKRKTHFSLLPYMHMGMYAKPKEQRLLLEPLDHGTETT